MDKKKDRESNIELLRILAMIGVIMLHYNNPTIGGILCKEWKYKLLVS